jgi:electron transfer flavoprotein beta subunit
LTLPAVISTDLRLNLPRYATLPNIMRARSKPLAVKNLDSLDLNLKSHTEILKVSTPPTRSGGIKVGSISELLEKLQKDAKVL